MASTERSGSSSQADPSERYGLLRRPAAWPLEMEEMQETATYDTVASDKNDKRPVVLRPQSTSISRPMLPRSATFHPVVGGSAGRLPALSAQRPGSAGGERGGIGGLRQQQDREQLPDRSKSVDADMLFRVAESPVDQKSSFYGAVREYEKNLSSLRKERDNLLDSLGPLRRQLEDAQSTVKALEAERQQLLAVRGRSDAASGALNETIDKLSVAQRRVRSLEKQLQDNESDWAQERQRLITRAEAAERRTADLAASIAQHERAALSHSEATHTDLKRQQAAHTKKLQAMDEQNREAHKIIKQAQEAERAASKSAHEWQERASSLERQLANAEIVSSDSANSVDAKLKQCSNALKRSEAELVRVRAEHAINAQRMQEMSQTRETKVVMYMLGR